MAAEQEKRPGDGRWPGWVYADGEEPDVRFTFANERTFLAWIRTALALVAAGVAVDAVDLGFSEGVQRVVAATLVVLGLVCAASSWVRWARAERALRHRRPLPSSGLSAVLTLGVVLIAAIVLVVGV